MFLFPSLKTPFSCFSNPENYGICFFATWRQRSEIPVCNVLSGLFVTMTSCLRTCKCRVKTEQFCCVFWLCPLENIPTNLSGVSCHGLIRSTFWRCVDSCTPCVPMFCRAWGSDDLEWYKTVCLGRFPVNVNGSVKSKRATYTYVRCVHVNSTWYVRVDNAERIVECSGTGYISHHDGRTVVDILLPCVLHCGVCVRWSANK